MDRHKQGKSGKSEVIMQLEKNRRGRELRVVLSGELDHHNAAIIREEIDRELDGSVKLLTLDMSGITFMDSSGIGVVLGRYRRMSESGGKLRMGGMSIYAEKILRMAGVLAMLERK